jgi:hypothetical protein
LSKAFPPWRGVGVGVRLAISHFALGLFHFASFCFLLRFSSFMISFPINFFPYAPCGYPGNKSVDLLNWNFYDNFVRK